MERQIQKMTRTEDAGAGCFFVSVSNPIWVVAAVQ